MNRYILHIDTASSRGMVMLSLDGTCVAAKVNLNPLDHAAFLQPAIQSLMQECDVQPGQLSCIAVANGPGSYTGLRVGLAGAKGLCYAWQKPLLTLSSLHIMAKAMQMQAHPEANDLPMAWIPMIDARRMEVFYAVYLHENLEIQTEPCAAVLDEAFALSLPENTRLFFAGDGAPKWQSVCPLTNVTFLSIETTDNAFAQLAHHQASACLWADLAYSEPFYAKAFYSPGKPLTSQ